MMQTRHGMPRQTKRRNRPMTGGLAQAQLTLQQIAGSEADALSSLRSVTRAMYYSLKMATGSCGGQIRDKMFFAENGYL